MNEIKIFRKSISIWEVMLLGLWLTALFVVSPFGNFPINDDWSYSKNVYNLAVNHEFIVDTFPAMNLIAQTIYGCLFTKLFGFSFVILRFSIFALVIISSLYFFRMVSMLSGQKKILSFCYTSALFFNPISLQLSFTFMTDMFFLAMIIFALYHFVKYLRYQQFVNYVWFIVFAILAVLTRQHGLLLALLSFIFLIKRGNWWRRLKLAFLPPVLMWLAHDKYRHYLCVFHIPNGIKYSDDIFLYLEKAEFKNHLIHAGDSLLVMGLILLPIIVLLLFSYKFSFKINHVLIFLGCSIFVVWLISNDWRFYPLGNISNILEVGPRLVKVNSKNEINNWLSTTRFIQLSCSVLASLSAIYFISDFKQEIDLQRRILNYLFFIIAFIFFVFVSISEAYFDRYCIPVIFFVIILLIPKQEIKIGNKLKYFILIICFSIFCFSTLEVRDYFNWQETRWTALNELNNKGISSQQIDGGFEYNGWYKPTEAWSGPGKSWWWVKDDEYIVSSQILNNYSVDRIYTYQHILPYYLDTVYVLRRK